MNAQNLEGLAPSVQITLIIVSGLVALAIGLAFFTDFWNNIFKK